MVKTITHIFFSLLSPLLFLLPSFSLTFPFGVAKKKEGRNKMGLEKEKIKYVSSRFHCGWCLNLISVPAIGLGHYDPLSSHEIDGVRKEKERLTAVANTVTSYPDL